MPQEFFPIRPEITPTIYAYEQIGVDTHIGLPIVFEKSDMRNDGTSFIDHDLHENTIIY